MDGADGSCASRNVEAQSEWKEVFVAAPRVFACKLNMIIRIKSINGKIEESYFDDRSHGAGLLDGGSLNVSSEDGHLSSSFAKLRFRPCLYVCDELSALGFSDTIQLETFDRGGPFRVELGCNFNH
jgi:hypothetical protein